MVLDLLYVLLTVASFAAAIAYVAVCRSVVDRDAGTAGELDDPRAAG